jgi:hypothetical protein
MRSRVKLAALLAALQAPLAAQVAVTTYHNDPSCTGLNPGETVLKPSNVNPRRFGRLFTQRVDGNVYAQPLYVPGLPIGGRVHNTVFVATEHDSVYAFDADRPGPPLWHVSFLDPASGVTTVPKEDVGDCGQISPEIGVTDTPVIDPAAQTLYVAAMTKQVSAGGTRYFQTLHALDLLTGAEKAGGPEVLGASVPGRGDKGTQVTLNPRAYKTRSGLVLTGGAVYTAFTSHCDFNYWGPYHGWLLGYDASDVTRQASVFCVTPDGEEGSIWSSGDAPSVDGEGNLYVETSNGTFDADRGGRDWGDSFLKLTAGSGGLAVADSFTPSDQKELSDSDQDLGSAGQVLLPDGYGDRAHPHLLTGADKTGEVYLLDRDHLGGYRQGRAGTDGCLQEFHPAALFNHQCFSTPACFRGLVYWSFVAQPLEAFRLSHARYRTGPASRTRERYAYPGCVPSVSSNGDRDGILWAIQPGHPAVLRAYDALDLSRELYASNQAPHGRDSMGAPNNKFTPPTIANGKVYVPTAHSLVVYGLLRNR